MDNPVTHPYLHGQPCKTIVFTWTTLQNNRIYMDNPVKNSYLHGQLCKTLVFTWTTL